MRALLVFSLIIAWKFRVNNEARGCSRHHFGRFDQKMDGGVKVNIQRGLCAGKTVPLENRKRMMKRTAKAFHAAAGGCTPCG